MSKYFLENEIISLPFFDKIIFTTICVQRMVRLFNLHYGEEYNEPSEALKILLNYLENDSTDGSTKKAIDNLSKVIPNIDEQGSQFTPSMEAGVSILYALDALENNSNEDMINSLYYCLEAVDAITEFEGHGIKEEMEYHKEILNEIVTRRLTKENISKIHSYFDLEPEWQKWWLNPIDIME